MLFVVGGATERGSLGRPGEEGTSSTAAPPLLCTLLLGVGLKILHRPNPSLASSEHAELDACQGSIPDLISSHLIWTRSPSLHSQSWFRPGLVPDLLKFLCIHTYIVLSCKQHIYIHYQHICVYVVTTCLCVINLWLAICCVHCFTQFTQCSFSQVVINSLCQSPSPHHPPLCFFPMPKLRLSG